MDILIRFVMAGQAGTQEFCWCFEKIKPENMIVQKSIRMVVSLLFINILLAGFSEVPPKENLPLKDALSGKFLIGTAMNTAQITGKDSASIGIILKHFNSIVAENCMKSVHIQPAEGVFDFTLADRFVDFGEKHGMHIIGHTLIWHSQAPAWLFLGRDGKDVSREVLIERIRNHIHTVVGRYKGRVHGWDVVNEAIEDDGSWRNSKFYQIIGKEYVSLAFQFAREADPDAELYYNDYSMAHQGRRNGVVRMVQELQAKGIKVDGIGMQGHMHLNFPSFEEFEKSIVAFSQLGVKVMITEMDISVLPPPGKQQGADVAMQAGYQEELNPYKAGLPELVARQLHDRYAGFFRLFLRHHDKISRVTMWGVTDKHSWKNNWPVRGRTDYPLLFDRNYQAKPIVETIIREASF